MLLFLLYYCCRPTPFSPPSTWQLALPATWPLSASLVAMWVRRLTCTAWAACCGSASQGSHPGGDSTWCRWRTRCALVHCMGFVKGHAIQKPLDSLQATATRCLHVDAVLIGVDWKLPTSQQQPCDGRETLTRLAGRCSNNARLGVSVVCKSGKHLVWPSQHASCGRWLPFIRLAQNSCTQHVTPARSSSTKRAFPPLQLWLQLRSKTHSCKAHQVLRLGCRQVTFPIARQGQPAPWLAGKCLRFCVICVWQWAGCQFDALMHPTSGLQHLDALLTLS
jgi:hypothetical protein